MRFVLLGIVCAALASMAAATGSGSNCSALIAASFSLAVPGGINPFDYQAFLVQVRLNLPNGSVFAVPAFYDGALQQQGGCHAGQRSTHDAQQHEPHGCLLCSACALFNTRLCRRRA